MPFNVLVSPSGGSSGVPSYGLQVDAEQAVAAAIRGSVSGNTLQLETGGFQTSQPIKASEFLFMRWWQLGRGQCGTPPLPRLQAASEDASACSAPFGTGVPTLLPLLPAIPLPSHCHRLLFTCRPTSWLAWIMWANWPMCTSTQVLPKGFPINHLPQQPLLSSAGPRHPGRRCFCSSNVSHPNTVAALLEPNACLGLLPLLA